MADREKILRYFKAGGDEQLAAKLLDLAEGANKSRKFRVSEFLDPHAYNVAEIIAANYENVRLESDGGFSNAEYELQEVNNKLGALKKAITMAENSL